MLVFTRDKEESFYLRIQDLKIEVKILGLGRSHVKIGVNAPKTVEVHRSNIKKKKSV